MNYLGDAINKPINKVAQLRQEFEKANEKAQILSTTAGQLGAGLSDMGAKGVTALEKLGEKINVITSHGGKYPSLGENVLDMGQALKGFFGQSIPNFLKGMFSMREGGVVPGATSQPVPIMAHGGETVLPAGGAPITININNPTVRSNSDISRIAEMVKQVLVDNQRYRHVT